MSFLHYLGRARAPSPDPSMRKSMPASAWASGGKNLIMNTALREKVPNIMSRLNTDFLDDFFLNFFFEKSVSYQKKDGCGHAHPFFFLYDNDSGQ